MTFLFTPDEGFEFERAQLSGAPVDLAETESGAYAYAVTGVDPYTSWSLSVVFVQTRESVPELALDIADGSVVITEGSGGYHVNQGSAAYTLTGDTLTVTQTGGPAKNCVVVKPGGGGGAASAEGGSRGGHAGTVVIRSGTNVTAIGKAGAAGIGRGQNGSFGAEPVDLEDGAITIEEGATVTAYTFGSTRFAIDVNETGSASVGGATILNARFLNKVLSKENPVNVSGNSADIEMDRTGTTFRAFATTVPGAGNYMVGNPAQGREVERAEYALLDADSAYLFTVADGAMTTRDQLRFTSFTITASAEANGSISDPGETAVSPLGRKTYTFTPAANHAVDTVTVDGVAVGVTGNSYTFENVAAHHTISVTFKAAGGTGPDGPDGPGDKPEKPEKPEKPQEPGDVNPPEKTPDVELPGEDVPLAPTPDGDVVIIVDESTPLGNLPQTGTSASGNPAHLVAAMAMAAALAAAGAGGVLLKKKNTER